MTILSPLKYMGNKTELMPTILEYIPKSFTHCIDAFGGSAVVSANMSRVCDNVLYTEFNEHTYKTIEALIDTPVLDTMAILKTMIDCYHLTKDNKEGYLKFRDFANEQDNYILYWICSRHAHSNLLRFSKKGFNTAFGARQLHHRLDEIEHELVEFQSAMKDVRRRRGHYADTWNKLRINWRKVFVYVDPPYLASGANIYGKWDEEDEAKLYRNLCKLDALGAKFMLSNITHHRHFKNKQLIAFCKKFNKIDLDKKYTLANNVQDSYGTREVLVTNY